MCELALNQHVHSSTGYYYYNVVFPTDALMIEQQLMCARRRDLQVICVTKDLC